VSSRRRIGIVVVSIAVAVVLGALYYRHYGRYPSTDNAYVDADVVQIVAQVSGPLVNLAVLDNQAGQAGDLLFEIDPRPFEIAVKSAKAQLDKTGQNVSAQADAVASAEAQLQRAKAALRLAQVQFRRVAPLADQGAVPYQDRDKAQAQLDGAISGLRNAQAQLTKARHELGEMGASNADTRMALAQLENAQLELSYCRVTAPVNGYVTNLALSPGSYANAGSPILSLVDTDSWRVVAYLKETQLRHIQPGQPATVHLPAYPGVRFEGSVQGIGWGIQQEEGTTGSEGLPSVSPTVDWVRMAQRFPVRITLVDRDPAHPLRKEMRASVRIDATGEGVGSADLEDGES
jgi:multidrug efflux system membrane fusion protein